MTQIVKKKGGRTVFDVPSGVIRASYCKDSGKLLSDACQYDPRGSRAETGWFLRGSEPHEFCDCHVLCDYDAEHGGVSHGHCPEAHLEKVALIRVEREFPAQIRVTDAQYVYRGDPNETPPNPDPKAAYFAALQNGFCGASNAEHPFNRSCPEHGGESGEVDEPQEPPDTTAPQGEE